MAATTRVKSALIQRQGASIFVIKYNPKLSINSYYMIRLAFGIQYGAQELTRALAKQPTEPLG
jgi:hypothetical protein